MPTWAANSATSILAADAVDALGAARAIGVEVALAAGWGVERAARLFVWRERTAMEDAALLIAILEVEAGLHASGTDLGAVGVLGE